MLVGMGVLGLAGFLLCGFRDVAGEAPRSSKVRNQICFAFFFIIQKFQKKI
jgi:hypothetical protein